MGKLVIVGAMVFSLGNGSGWGRKKMESLLRLCLRTINTVPLHGRIDLTTREWVQILGMGIGRC